MTKDDRETLRQLLDAWTEGQVSEPLATRAAVALPELLADSERLEQVREWAERQSLIERDLESVSGPLIDERKAYKLAAQDVLAILTRKAGGR